MKIATSVRLLLVVVVVVATSATVNANGIRLRNRWFDYDNACMVDDEDFNWRPFIAADKFYVDDDCLDVCHYWTGSGEGAFESGTVCCCPIQRDNPFQGGQPGHYYRSPEIYREPSPPPFQPAPSRSASTDSSNSFHGDDGDDDASSQPPQPYHGYNPYGNNYYWDPHRQIYLYWDSYYQRWFPYG